MFGVEVVVVVVVCGGGEYLQAALCATQGSLQLALRCPVQLVRSHCGVVCTAPEKGGRVVLGGVG